MWLVIFVRCSYGFEGLLPKQGLLSFLYEEENAAWGYDPKHKGCARVFYFEHINELKKAEFPEDLQKRNFENVWLVYQCF